MWGCQYDENLNNNQFFREILTNHCEIIKQVLDNNWIICVPRTGTFQTNEVTYDVILNHILIPTQNSFTTLSKKSVSVNNKQIKTCHQTVQILFEETFYVDSSRYLVYCIERPLFVNHPICDAHRPSVLETLHDCIDFLWGENLGHFLGRIQKLCASFTEQNNNFATENLQTQKDLIGSLYSQCLQVILKKHQPPLTVNSDCENLKLAIETYMQSCMDATLMRGVNTVTCFQDCSFNKIVRNSSELQLRDLNIGPQFRDLITNAKLELGKINNYVTILDKVNCLKLTSNLLHNASINLTSDDLLQIFAFLIIKLNVNNWTANLVFLTQFQFSSLNTANETNFLITTLEAALEFIKSAQFTEIIKKSSQFVINPLFQAVADGDFNKLNRAFNNPIKQESPTQCHPLCDCDTCNLLEPDHDLNCNEKGQSTLIFATLLGKNDMVEFLIGLGEDVNKFDYFGKTALHYACLKGYQDVLLILINSKALINVKDNEGNSPLHLACNNGHESCVKALFYTSKTVDLDCVNKHGDTPLHLAVKWNYINIVKVLLENQAISTITNKKNQLAINLATNYYTEKILKQYNKNLEPVHESTYTMTDIKNVSCKEHGLRPKSLELIKKIDLLLKAIENNDLPLTCFYLGFSNSSHDYNFEKKCHPLCNCEKCFNDQDSLTSKNQDHVNVNTCNIDGFTPLHFVAKYGRSELLRILLDSGALPNLKTYKTLQTPLHLACIYQRLEIVKELVKCGNCDLDSQDYKGNTALYYACFKNDAKIVEVLLVNGANCDVRNYQGHSIIKEVQEKCLYGITTMLKDQKTIKDDDFL